MPADGLGGRPLTPTLANVLHPTATAATTQGTPLKALLLAHDTADMMDLDQSMAGAGTPPGRPPLSDARVGIRTPLPGSNGSLLARGPSEVFARGYPDKQLPLPGIESLGSHVASAQMSLERIMAARSFSRYTATHVLLLSWQEDTEAVAAVEDLGRMFASHYGFICDAHQIPHEASWKWLSKVILGGPEDTDHRDVLKIVYYNGYSHLDASREMVLARCVELLLALMIMVTRMLTSNLAPKTSKTRRRSAGAASNRRSRKTWPTRSF
jgi:hypothetical protein